MTGETRIKWAGTAGHYSATVGPHAVAVERTTLAYGDTGWVGYVDHERCTDYPRATRREVEAVILATVAAQPTANHAPRPRGVVACPACGRVISLRFPMHPCRVAVTV